ncbi:MAG: hypothetical protein H6Q04_3212 [Acidobacteria bacterium]|nr:hypothetical protein [Acidobacteriota bacterium]
MSSGENKKPVLVIPCSGIGKVHGLLTREAAYLVTDEIAPEQTETICLGLLVNNMSGPAGKRTGRSRRCCEDSVRHHNRWLP